MCLLLAQNTLDNTLQCAPCGCAAGGDRAMCTKKCKEEFTEVASLTIHVHVTQKSLLFSRSKILSSRQRRPCSTLRRPCRAAAEGETARIQASAALGDALPRCGRPFTLMARPRRLFTDARSD